MHTTAKLESFDQLLSQRTKISLVSETDIDRIITVCGWISAIRKQKDLIFVKLSDDVHSKLFPIQIVADTSCDPMYFDELEKSYVGTSLIAKGKIIKSPGQGQSIEMQLEQYLISGHIRDPLEYPLSGTASEHLEYLRSYPHLECHTLKKSAIYKIRSELMATTDLFFSQKGYMKVDMPTITFSECEGGCQPMQVTLLLTEKQKSTIPTIKEILKSDEKTDEKTELVETDRIDFEKDFFKTMASLTVSSQLELETQLPMGDCYVMGKAFRGEKSQTSRHLCEFVMLEIEKTFTRSAVDIMDITEEYIKYCIRYVIDHLSDYITALHSEKGSKFRGKKTETKTKAELHFEKLERYATEPFIRITHAQAVEMLLKDVADGKITFKELPSYTEDMGSEHERYLTDIKYSHPVIVQKYPKAVKAFYMPIVTETLEESHGVEHVDSFDILVPEVGELVGGSQRIHKLDELLERIDELQLDREPLEFYIDLRKYGSIPHGGMGMGFERLIKFVTGIDSVKDCIAFPRYLGSGKKHSEQI